MSEEEINIMRREMDRVQQDRLSHLEARIESIDDRLSVEMTKMETRFDHRLSQQETLIAERSASIAVKRAFGHLGVDVDNPSELKQFNENLQFSGMVRETMIKSLLAILASVCGVIGVSVAMFFKAKAGIP